MDERHQLTSFRSIVEALDAAPSERTFVTEWIDEDEQQTVTFGEFRRRAGVAASALGRHGIGRGERVIIIMPQGIPAMSTFVGAMMLGAVPAFLAYPNFKIDPTKYRSGLAGVAANLRAHAVVIDEAFPDDLLGYIDRGDALLLRSCTTSGEELAVAPEAGAEDLAFIQHSAGTTGLQKGVALTHAAVLRHLAKLQQALRLDPTRDRIYNWLPLYHDMGLIACFLLPMACHVPVVMQSPLDWVMHPESMLQIISDFQCTLAWLPNFAFQFVARRTSPERRSRFDLSSMRAFINCSEPVRAASIDEFKTAFTPLGLAPFALQSSYAMAENVFAVTQSPIDQTPSRIWADARVFRTEHHIVPVAEGTDDALCFVSSGRLLPGTEVRILADSGDLLAPGQVGEIVVRSDTLLEGYFNRPDLTARAIMDGWYHTGDLGFVFGSDLYVVGRKNDLIIIGGENVYPQDIEEIVSSHPAIHDGRVVALGRYNPDLGTEDIVVVAEVEDLTLAHDSAALERELRELVVAGTGVAVRTILLKPPKWIIKSTAGKPARAATREKLFREHPELGAEAQE
jgi:fatty-acyl-CoA synthase